MEANVIIVFALGCLLNPYTQMNKMTFLHQMELQYFSYSLIFNNNSMYIFL